jgi:REP element-mobilizing transposase RayT
MKPRARQREFGFTNWGGKRRGAGRKPRGVRAGVTHAKRPKLSAHHPVLVTLRLRAGLRSLREREAHALVRRALAASSKAERFRVVEYSAQSNHLHLLVEAQSSCALARGMNALTVRLVRGLQRLWKVCGRLLADRRARTWLLSIGWRRHGLLGSLEAPAPSR